MNVDIRDYGRQTANDTQSDIWAKIQTAINDGCQQISLFACASTVDDVTGVVTTEANVICFKTFE